MVEPSDTSRETAMAAVQAIFERYHLIATSTSFNGYDKHVMENVKLLDASAKGTVEYEFEIGERYGNVNGVMHGGAAGVVFDMCTTTALGPLARRGFWDFLGGVTRTLNISYLKAIPVGTTIKIKSQVMQVGRTMAMIRGVMVSMDGKTTYATCEHHKVAVPSRVEHMEHKVPWDKLWDAKL